jgi:hypothetical protein
MYTNLTYHSLELFRQIVSALLPADGEDSQYREKLLRTINEMMDEVSKSEADDVQ